MKPLLWVGGGVALLAVAGWVIIGQRTVGDPLHRERGKAAQGASSAEAQEEKDTSNQRWRQRLEERQAARAAAAANGTPNGGVVADGRELSGPGQTAAAGLPARDANGNPATGSHGSAFTGDVGAGARDEARGAHVTPGGAIIDTGAAAEPNTPHGSSGTSRPGTGSNSGALGTSAKAPPIVRGCGDGVLEAGEECEPASSPKCGDDCLPVISDACYDCEVNSVCVAIANSCADNTKSKLEQSLCYDVSHCIQDTGCAAGDKTLTSCFCGDMSTAQCRDAPSSGDQAPHGACADVIRDAMGGAVSNAFVLTHYTTSSTPAGVAIKRFQCLKANETCSPVCFRK